MEQKFGQIMNYAGTTVSINLAKSTYLRIGPLEDGQFKVWLGPNQWCVQVPPGLTNDEARQLKEMLDVGILVEGKQYMPVAVHNTKTLQDYLNVVKKSRVLDKKTKDIFVQLVRKKSEGNYSAFEILNACLKAEEETSRRPEWIAFLNDGIKAYDGPRILLEKNEVDPEAYTVAIDSTGAIVKDSRPEEIKNKSKKGKLPELKERELTPEQKEKALNQFLGESI
jgi:hypothetical protein